MENKRYVIYKDKKSVGLMDVGKIDADCNLDMFSLYSDKEGIELMAHSLDSICCHLNEQWETIQEQKREINQVTDRMNRSRKGSGKERKKTSKDRQNPDKKE